MPVRPLYKQHNFKLTQYSKMITFIIDQIANLETAIMSMHEGENMAKKLETEFKKYEIESICSDDSNKSDLNNSIDFYIK